MKFLERKVIKEIKRFINTDDIIVLHGARQVGKTSIMKYLQDDLTAQKKNTAYIDLEDLRFVQLLDSGTQEFIGYLREKNLLKKSLLYLFIDEIQYLKNPSNFLKIMRDHYAGRIKLLVSGSSSFELKSKFKESLVGRTVNFEVYPLSFREWLFFKGHHLNLGQKVISGLTTEELKKSYKEYVLYGGYPRIVLENDVSRKEVYLQQIIDTYIRKDIRDLAGIKDILRFNKLLEVLSEQSGKLLNILELANTVRLARPTIENYLFLMENTYVLKMLRPFSSNLRSELFKTPKIFFYDTGIAHLLWLKTLPRTILGNMFETSVFAELIKRPPTKELFFWRTQDKKEIDFIVRKGKNIIPLEVKLSQSNFNFTAMKYFGDKYKTKAKLCVSLEKDQRTRKQSAHQISFIYPWEIDRELEQ
ncbi:MAG: ATP-binding protein [Planctomycetota bacterium]|mgnify:CR=1 FL=1